MLPLLKRYDGIDYCFDINNLNPLRKRIYFSDEQEWRYLPPDVICKIEAKYKNIELGMIKAQKMNIETPYYKHYLQIPIDEVEYIIIRKPKELIKVIEIFKGIYTKRDIELLLTKLQFSDNILRDF